MEQKRTKSKRFKKYCIKCGDLFRPEGKSGKMCIKCRKRALQKNSTSQRKKK